MANTDDTADSDTNGASEKPELTKAQTLKLFAAADKADKLHTEAKEAVAEAQIVVSEAVQAIYEQVGTGPFAYKGREFSASKKHDLYFFKNLGKRSLTKIA